MNFDGNLHAGGNNGPLLCLPVSMPDKCATEVPIVSRSAKRRWRRRAAAKKLTSGHALNFVEAMTEEERTFVIEQLERGGTDRMGAMNNIRGRAVSLAKSRHGCRVFQRALEVGSEEEKRLLANELKGFVQLLLASPHGNFVLQRVVELLPVAGSSFVAQELSGAATNTAMHRFGCRILCRLGEHHLNTDQASATPSLFAELLQDAEALMNHQFARHVLVNVIEFGSDVHHQALATIVAADPYKYACSRVASYVIEKLLEFGDPTAIDRIGTALLQDEANFLRLIQHESGVHVATALVLARNVTHNSAAGEAKRFILQRANELKATKFGARLLRMI